MTTVTFRAAGTPGAPAPRLAPAASGQRVYLADFSEYQPDVNDAAYLAWSKAGIFRAMHGTTADRAWYGGARRDALHAGGARFTGIYQYLDAGLDAGVQARALVALVGPLRPGEKLVCDLEEGPPGSWAARWRQWQQVVTGAYGAAAAPWLYASLSPSAAAGVSPQWVAAYQAAEPGGSHLLWQFTDAYPVPGVGTCDCSVFNGTIDQLAAHGWQGGIVPPAARPPAPPPAPGPGGLTATPWLYADLAWSPVPGARGYRWQAAPGTPAAPGQPFTQGNVAGAHAGPVLLGPPGPYVFRVQADGEPWSPWKAV